MNKVQEITSEIARSIDEVLGHPSFQRWVGQESKTMLRPGDILFINNSFVFRDVKTKKSELYLAIEMGQNLKRGNNLYVGNTHMNADFKFCTSVAEKNSLVPLHVKLEDQLQSLGQLVFILIGQVRDDAVIETQLSHSVFKKLIWKPKIKSTSRIHEEKIFIRDIQEWDTIWQTVEAHYRKMIEDKPETYLKTQYRKSGAQKKKKDPATQSTTEANDLQKAIKMELDELKKVMEAGILDLQSQAFANLVIPTIIKKKQGNPHHILCRIVEALQMERKKYYDALVDFKTGTPNAEQALHEILRISYNFEKEAVTLLNLVVSICDLKPVILWGTIGKHHDLSEAFRALPWFIRAYKPSLRNYKAIIDDARNSAFHNVFPFHKTLEIALPPSALRGTRLRIFSEYENKKQNALNFQDKELVDVLVEFTRARTRPAATEFWEKNLVVMDALIALFSETGRFLSVLRLAPDRAGGKYGTE